jgi:MurNAc alpha-1-phosphate uridylyltransferase
MVPNPPYHPRGDFALLPPGRADAAAITRDGHSPRGRLVALPPDTVPSGAAPLTFGNIGVYDSVLFAELPRGTRLKLLPLFLQWIAAGIVVGERFDGPWANVGTPDELARLDAALTDPA